MPAAIRPARVSDLDALLALENAVFPGDRLSRRSFRRLIDSPSAAMLVAAGDTEVDGYGAVLFRAGARAARLYSLAARPDARGTGGRLLEALERVAGSRAEALRLEVRQDNDRAIALYERCGYRRIGSIPEYYQDGAPALRYEKPLAYSAAVARRRAEQAVETRSAR